VFFLVGVPQIIGMSEVSEERLHESVEAEITGTYFGIFPSGIFLIRPRILEERLRSEYPLFASVSVTRVFPTAYASK
jgi:hypothetical protein